MKTYEIIIRPISGFGTPLKGDTLFGHICWQAFYDELLFGMTLQKLIDDYEHNPFLIVSSAYPNLNEAYALKRPDMPIYKLFDFGNLTKAETIKKRKELKGKRWMLLNKNKPLENLKEDGLYLNDAELFKKLSSSEDFELHRKMRKNGIRSIEISYSQPHNTINRITGTTGEGQFTPYTVDQSVYTPLVNLVIFAGLRQDIKIEQLIEAFKRIGKTGFGKDASTGLGRFEVIDYKPIDLRSMGSNNANALYTLSPVSRKNRI